MTRPMKSKEPPVSRFPVVLVGLDSMQGLQAARILADRGVSVIAVASNPRHDACRTRVCEEIHFAKTRTDELIPALMQIGQTLPTKAVLLPCEDASVRSVSRARDQLSEWFHISLPPPDVVEMLMDKTRFYSFAMSEGLPIPATHFLKTREDMVSAADSVQYPVILKPSNSATRLWQSNTDISAFRLATDRELIETYDRVHSWTDVMILQEWIPGSDSNLISCNAYVDAEGTPQASFVAKKVRQWPPHIGKSCMGIEWRNDDVLNATLDLFRRVGYRGLGYVEFKIDDRTGKPVIIEPNVGRPTGRSAIAEAGGVELLLTMYCDTLGLPLPTERIQRYGSAKWVHLRRDLQSALYYWRRGELTPIEWARSLRGPKSYALFSLKDPGPFISDLFRVSGLVFRRAPAFASKGIAQLRARVRRERNGRGQSDQAS